VHIRRLVGLPVVGLLLCAGHNSARADLFDEARRAINTSYSQNDTSGVYARGRVNLETGQRPQNTTLLRTSASSGKTCSAFDFRLSMHEAFHELPALFEALLGEVISEIPMLALCYASPTLCQIGEHFQALLNAAIQAKYANCQQIQLLASYGAQRLRGGEQSACLEDHVNAGSSVQQAMQQCGGAVSSVRGASGVPGAEVNLVQDALSFAGATTETQVLASTLLGEVTIRANNGALQASSRRAPAAMLARYQSHKDAAAAGLQAAVQEYKETGTVAATTLQDISIPGQPVSRATVEALAAMDADQIRKDAAFGQLSTAAALARLTWDCHELENTLRGAAEGNANFSAEQLRLMEGEFQQLQRNLLQTMQKVDVMEKYGAAVDKVMMEYTRVLTVATRAGITAPTRTVTSMPYGTQMPSGYGN